MCGRVERLPGIETWVRVGAGPFPARRRSVQPSCRMEESAAGGESASSEVWRQIDLTEHSRGEKVRRRSEWNKCSNGSHDQRVTANRPGNQDPAGRTPTPPFTLPQNFGYCSYGIMRLVKDRQQMLAICLSSVTSKVPDTLCLGSPRTSPGFQLIYCRHN